MHRARLNDRGYEKFDGVHYDSANIASPVTNDESIKIVSVLTIMSAWTTKILDVKGALLHGEFTENEEPIYIEIPQGFYKYLAEDYVLLLLKTLHGLKNAAYNFCPPRGWKLKPEQKWDGEDKRSKFRIGGRIDSDYVVGKMIRRSVSGYAVYLEGEAILMKSAMQKTVALLVTEAELNASASCAQDMMYALRVLESLGL